LEAEWNEFYLMGIMLNAKVQFIYLTNDSQVQPRSVAGYATVATAEGDIKRLVGALDGTIDHTLNLISISHYCIDELEYYIKPFHYL